MIDHERTCEILNVGFCTCHGEVVTRTCPHCAKDLYLNRENVWTHVYPAGCNGQTR